MTYAIADVKGYVSHGPSIHGMAELRKALKRVADVRNYPQVNMFLDEGYATEPKKLKAELKRLLPKIKDKDCQKSVQELISAATKCREIIILTN